MQGYREKLIKLHITIEGRKTMRLSLTRGLCKNGGGESPEDNVS